MFGREMGIVYKILVRKPEEKGPFRRPGHRWKDNIRMDLQEIGWVFGYWINVAQDRDHSRLL
jgi:hypothetical protein